MIPQRNISLLSNRLAREGGRRIPEAVLERDYCLAWFLVGLSNSPICKSLIFKGGTALKRCYFRKYRFSEDLDFTLAEEMPLETILAGFEKVYAEVRQIFRRGYPLLPGRPQKTSKQPYVLPGLRGTVAGHIQKGIQGGHYH